MNLFIVESPFQLLSAIEANNNFQEKDNLLIIKYSSYRTHRENNKQLKILKNNINWMKIIEIEAMYSTKQSNLKLLLFIKKLKKQYNKFDKIFIGEYRSWQQREYCNLINPNKCFVLDDGNMAIELQESYISTGKYYYFGSNYYKQVFDKIQHRVLSRLLYGFTKSRIDFNVFTCFTLKASWDKQIVINHSFEYLKQQNKFGETLEDIVYFFGGNISELNLITLENELKEIKKVKLYFKKRGIKLIYLPHRRESKEKLNLIQKDLKIKLRYSTYPAEIEFIMMETLPQYLASFMSTALLTVSKIKNFKEVISFKLNYKDVLDIYLNDIRNTYRYYENEMKVIDLD